MAANVWLIDGLLTPASAGRIGNFQATKGATGIALPRDLQVRALPTPGGAVQIMPGGAAIENTFTSASKGQSYMTQLEELEQLEIPATGSGGGTTRRIWQRINDPQYSGSTMGASFHYGSKWPTTYPFVKLATIVQPANRADITQDQITDERVVAAPRSDVVLRARASVVADAETLTATGTDGEWFPNKGGEQSVFIPEWATRMIIEADWIQINEPGGNAWGAAWVEWGPYERPSTRKYACQKFGWNTHNGTDAARNTWSVADDRYVHAALRGTTQPFIMKARIEGKSTNAARPQLTGYSGVKLRITFLEVADPSTS